MFVFGFENPLNCDDIDDDCDTHTARMFMLGRWACWGRLGAVRTVKLYPDAR